MKKQVGIVYPPYSNLAYSHHNRYGEYLNKIPKFYNQLLNEKANSD